MDSNLDTVHKVHYVYITYLIILSDKKGSVHTDTGLILRHGMLEMTISNILIQSIVISVLFVIYRCTRTSIYVLVCYSHLEEAKIAVF